MNWCREVTGMAVGVIRQDESEAGLDCARM